MPPDVVMLASAKRVLPPRELTTVTRVASAALIFSTRAVSACASWRDSSVDPASCRRLPSVPAWSLEPGAWSLEPSHEFLAVFRMRTLRKRAGTQPWLTELICDGSPLPSLKAPPEPVGRLAADHVHRVPEHRRVALVGHVAQHAHHLAVAHFVVGLAGELEVVALVVDRPGAAVLDHDAPVGRGDDVGQRDVLLARQQRHVGHALELHRVPRLGVGAAVRARHAGQLLDLRGLLARGLVVLEDALLDQQPAIGRHAFVVPRHSRQRPLLRAIGLHVHLCRAIGQLADHLLGRGDEARAGVVGLLADARDRARWDGRSIRGSSATGWWARGSGRRRRPRRSCAASFSTAIDAQRSALPGMSSDST